MSEPARIKRRTKPPHEPTHQARLKVSALAACGVPAETIAHEIGISKPTLLKYYRDELTHGRERIHAKLKGTAIGKALSGNIAMLIFVLKTQCGWADRQITEHVGKDGGPIAIDAVFARILKDREGAAKTDAAPQ